MQAVGKIAIVGGALSVLALVTVVYFARPDTSIEAPKIAAIPDRMETYRAIDEACLEKQNRNKCLADLLAQAEHDLEQALDGRLKDTWPTTRDASCPSTNQDELNRCRIYETLKFGAQVQLFRANDTE